MADTPKSKPVRSSGWLLNLLCFIAVIFIGISLILSRVGLSGKVSSALSLIAQVISYSALVIISCFYIVKRKNIWLWIIWGISVALIVIHFFLPVV